MRLPALLVTVVALAGCSDTEVSPPVLPGTSWQLVSIQSMSDDQGTTDIADPSRYTVSFGTDGQAAFQIDCNRGSGTFQATPAASDPSGELTFGPIALTMMGCAQPSLDQRVARDLGFVRGYLMKDGQLHMSLFADGGILHWRPA